MTDELDRLLQAACAARARSYAPYSGFRVGAALLGADGRIVTGVNVENASFGLSLCAERAAVVRALADGCRDFRAIAICGSGEAPTPPCGACRQVLQEFAPSLTVILAGERGAGGEVVQTTLAALLPHAFTDFRDRRGESDQDRS